MNNNKATISRQPTADSLSCPLISVIVPVYKVENYLDRCIASIVGQTYKNLEIILIDDGSPDNCPAMCDEWALRDSRIKVIHKKNGGLSSARNAGLDFMSGEFVSFVDSDDFITPEMYETLYGLIRDSGADMSICNYLEVDEDEKPLTSRHNSRNDIDGEYEVVCQEDLFKQWMTQRGWYVVSCCKLYHKKTIFESLRFPEGRIHEDEFLVHHIFDKCRKAAVTGKRMYMYTQRDGSIMGGVRNSFSMKRTEDVMCMVRERINFFRDTGRNDFVKYAVMFGYIVMLDVMRKGKFLKHKTFFTGEIVFLSKECFKQKGIKMKLRPVKLLIYALGNIILDLFGCRKFPPEKQLG